MTDRGSFSVQSETLRNHAMVWQHHSSDADAAYTEMSPAIGMGQDLGYLAGLNGVEEYYNTWTRDMGAALQDASATFSYLHAALISTANDYDGTDSTVAANVNQLDRLNNVR